MKRHRPETQIIASARRGLEGSVNPPVVRASTIQFPDFASMIGEKPLPTHYGIRQVDTVRQLESLVAELEHAQGCVTTSSGLAAASLVFDAFLQEGDAVALTDNVYLPTREFADEILAPRGHNVTYFPVTVGADIVDALTPETRVVLLETPGSLTFELQDIRAAVRAIRKFKSRKDIIIVCDNTWSCGVFLKPLDLGVDVSLQAGTKFLAGHSDLLLGTLAASGEVLDRLKHVYNLRGDHLCADIAYLAIRGSRTLYPRLQQHQRSALEIAHWLNDDPRVQAVYYPALPCHPQHALWKQEFTGASSLFSFSTRECANRDAVAAFVDSMEIFRMGFSWGGFESLLIPTWPHRSRVTQSSVDGTTQGQIFRIHVGLEHPEDLIDDLKRALNRYEAACIG